MPRSRWLPCSERRVKSRSSSPTRTQQRLPRACDDHPEQEASSAAQFDLPSTALVDTALRDAQQRRQFTIRLESCNGLGLVASIKSLLRQFVGYVHGRTLWTNANSNRPQCSEPRRCSEEHPATEKRAMSYGVWPWKIWVSGFGCICPHLNRAFPSSDRMGGPQPTFRGREVWCDVALTNSATLSMLQ
jgi:hypothetical protein